MKILEIPKKIEVWTKVKETLQMMQKFRDYKSLVTILTFKNEKVQQNKRRLGKRLLQKVFVLQEVCQCNLLEDIRKRYSLSYNQRKYFSEEELLNILCPIVIMLAEFQKKQLAHRNLRICNFLRGFDGQYKITGMGYIQTIASCTIPYPRKETWKASIQQQVKHPLHYSQERIDLWKKCDDDIEEDLIYKADVYSLGLVILQAGNLSLDLAECLNFTQSLSFIKDKYSKNFYQILQKMLKKDPI